jgi:preprotein translocase subunit YajC
VSRLKLLSSVPFIAAAAATQDPAEVPSIMDLIFSPTTLILIAMIVAMYFLMIRPESKRKKAALKMRNELIVGDEVTTVAGIVGRVISIKDDTITIETGSDKTRLTFVKGAITSKTEVISS